MSQLSIVKSGGEVMTLPHGFRFCPTDEELVLQYLKQKVFFLPLPADIIPEFELFKSDPWDLPGDAEEEMYFFSTKDSNRTTPSGYWRVTGIDKPVVASGCHVPQVTVGIKRALLEHEAHKAVVGVKKTFVFYTDKSTPTDWTMHEYQLASLESLYVSGHAPPLNQLTQENWVLCRIYRKMKGTNVINIGEQKVSYNPAKKKCTGQGVLLLDLNKPHLDLNEPHVVSPASSGTGIGIPCDRDSDNESDDEDEEYCSCDRDSSQDESP